MNDFDKAEIIALDYWRENKNLTIYGIYSPPNNTSLNLDILNITNNTIILGDLNGASPTWGYGYTNAVGAKIEDFINSNSIELVYNKDDPATFIHYTGNSTNPDLVMVSSQLMDKTKREVIEDAGSGHRAVVVNVKLTKMITELN